MSAGLSLMLVKAKFGINCSMPNETCARERIMILRVFSNLNDSMIMKHTMFVCCKFEIDGEMYSLLSFDAAYH